MKSVRLEIAEATPGKLYWKMWIDGQAPLSGMCEVTSSNDKTRLIACAAEALAHYTVIKEAQPIIHGEAVSHLDDWMKL